MQNFSCHRLKVARLRAEFTIKALAEEVGVHNNYITMLESGKRQPSEEMLERLAWKLRVPPTFFYGPEVEPIPKGAPSFRAFSSLKARPRDSALAAGAYAVLLAKAADTIQPPLKVDVPDLKETTSPEVAAVATRKHWGLGLTRLGNMVHLLESRGIRVFHLPRTNRELGAFCWWDGEVPFVMATTALDGERCRFDMAHELGHLVHDRDRSNRSKVSEVWANAFASAFLMPADDVRQHLPPHPNLKRLLPLRRRWGTSVQAMIVRGYHLGIYSEWQYNRAFVDLSRRGWRRGEPNAAEPETSYRFGRLYDKLRQQGTGPDLLASLTCLPLEEVKDLTWWHLLAKTPQTAAPPLVATTRTTATVRTVTRKGLQLTVHSSPSAPAALEAETQSVSESRR